MKLLKQFDYPDGRLEFTQERKEIYGKLNLDFVTGKFIGKVAAIHEEVFNSQVSSCVKLQNFPPKVGDKIQVANLRLRVVGNWDNFGESFLVIQENDRLTWFFWLVWRLVYQIKLIKYRLIITATIWGLGKRKMYLQPEWSDVYGIGFVQKYFYKIKEKLNHVKES